MSVCLDADALFDFATGAPCAAATGAHIASCAECASLIDDLIRFADRALVVVLSPADAAHMDLFREALRAASTGVHVPLGVLEAYSAGELTPTGEELVVAHLVGCLPCAMALSELVSEARWGLFVEKHGRALGLGW